MEQEEIKLVNNRRNGKILKGDSRRILKVKKRRVKKWNKRRKIGIN